MKQNLSDRRTAFTLIELLTVIAIIGILASILIPVVGKVRESAWNSTSVSNARQIALSGNLFETDSNHFPGGKTNGDWTRDLEPYLAPRVRFDEGGEDSIWFSPAMTNLFPNIHGGNLTSYGMNRWLYRRAGPGALASPVSADNIPDPSRKAMILESLMAPGGYFTAETAHYIYNAYRSAYRENERDLNIAFVDGHVERWEIADVLAEGDESEFWGVVRYE